MSERVRARRRLSPDEGRKLQHDLSASALGGRRRPKLPISSAIPYGTAVVAYSGPPARPSFSCSPAGSASGQSVLARKVLSAGLLCQLRCRSGRQPGLGATLLDQIGS